MVARSTAAEPEVIKKGKKEEEGGEAAAPAAPGSQEEITASQPACDVRSA